MMKITVEDIKANPNQAFKCLKQTRSQGKIGGSYRVALVNVFPFVGTMLVLERTDKPKSKVHSLSISLTNFKMNFKAVKMVSCPCCGSTVQGDRVKNT